MWSAALPVAGLTVPVYRNRTQTVPVHPEGTADESPGVISSSGSDTLVDVNGDQVLLVLLVPLVISLVVAGALLGRHLHGAIPLAWTLTVALLCGTALALLSIGVFVLPVPIALLVACAATPARPSSSEALPTSHLR